MRTTRRLARDEHGIALITAVLIMFIMGVLVVVLVQNLRSDLGGVQQSKEVTSARSAADAGIDQLVFKLQQTTNWTSFPTWYSTTSGVWYGTETSGANANWSLIGNGRYRAHVDALGQDLLLTVQGQYPAGAGKVRTIAATVRRTAPAGLSFAMLADRGIDIHHHGGSWVSPTIVTTKIHSNGYVKLQWSSSYHVEQIEAGTTLTVGSGGGATPGGTIPAGGYLFPYWVSGTDTANAPRCYPSKIFPPKTIDSSDTANFDASWNKPALITHSCAGNGLYSRNAQILGDLYANTVAIQSTGDTVTSSSGGAVCSTTSIPGVNDPITNSCIPDKPGDVHAGTVTVGGTTHKGIAAGTGNQINTVNCPVCSQGTGDQGGHVGGVLKLHPQDFTPGHVEFPSLNFAATELPLAQTDQGGTTCANKENNKTCHVFPTTGAGSVDFLTYLATKENVTDKDSKDGSNPYGKAITNCPSKNCLYWQDDNHARTTDKTKVAYVIAQGTYYVSSTSLALDSQAIRTLFGTGSGKPTPVLMIAGALVVPTGNINISSSITVVGPTMDPFKPLASYPSTTVPGLLASGKGIHSSDTDTDSSWTSLTQYESLKRSAATIRGLVYSATWNAATGHSLATDQHWHNYDPKNSTTIIGAQVGNTLHDCNSFVFSYDPLVANLPGFITSTGTSAVYIVDWREI